MRTPSDIEVLLHYYVSPEPHPRETAPAIVGTIEMYLNTDILEVNTLYDSNYQVTAKGKAWLQMILSVPYPTQVWVDGDGTVIKL